MVIGLRREIHFDAAHIGWWHRHETYDPRMIAYAGYMVWGRDGYFGLDMLGLVSLGSFGAWVDEW